MLSKMSAKTKNKKKNVGFLENVTENTIKEFNVFETLTIEKHFNSE